jgi:hypothetical protein
MVQSAWPSVPGTLAYVNPRASTPTSSNIRVYLRIRGGSRKKMAKKIIPNVPTNKNVYTNASIQKNPFTKPFSPFHCSIRKVRSLI